MTASAVSEEIWYKLFQGLTVRDLNECQKVCHAWYSAAHSLLLKNIHLTSNLHAELFLISLSSNTLCVNAITHLELGEQFEGSIDVKYIQRIFSYLSNIKELVIYGDKTRDNFVDCILEHRIECPKLEKLTYNLELNTHQLYEIEGLQQTLTNVYVTDDATLSLLPKFANLQHLCISVFRNFEEWLPLIEQLMNLKAIDVVLAVEDEDYFMEKYLKLKTEQQRCLILNNLAKIETLVVYDACLDHNSIRFITNYLTGLKKLEFEAWYISSIWEDSQLRSRCKELLDLVTRFSDFNVHLEVKKGPFFADFILDTIKKIYHQIPPNIDCTDKTLWFDYQATLPDSESSALDLESTQFNNGRIKRLIRLKFAENQFLMDYIKEGLIENNINTFMFRCKNQYPTTYLTALQDLLDSLPSVVQVTLDITDSRYSLLAHERRRQYNQVRHLVLNRYNGLNFEEPFAYCMYIFPKITVLSLFRICGLWRAVKNQYEIPLQNLNLERLHLDVTPVLERYRNNNQDLHHFFLKIQTSTKQRLFRISLDYLTLEVINNIADRECTLVSIDAKNLQYINLYLYRGTAPFYMFEHLEDVIENKIILI